MNYNYVKDISVKVRLNARIIALFWDKNDKVKEMITMDMQLARNIACHNTVDIAVRVFVLTSSSVTMSGLDTYLHGLGHLFPILPVFMVLKTALSCEWSLCQLVRSTISNVPLALFSLAITLIVRVVNVKHGPKMSKSLLSEAIRVGPNCCNDAVPRLLVCCNSQTPTTIQSHV